ncbi:alpha/beta fold hydrolase [Sporosarcina sp. Te-1]|uniref:alpha/beta fold hydrolase n=1 Tax=Sporosarcina sp. Te-1 TaxID=2818390 RepID=UPI001A9EDD04|nr:alpha/beta hydrolase [Sporosarcina sp. Te-1]QTD42077.1 alpha/beta hydrolase [Sporosarcina sp. Te-1]
MIEKYVKCNHQVEIRYLEWGSSENTPLLLLHGLGSIASSWMEIAERFSCQYHVIAVDLPGHGNSTPLTVYSLENLNTWLDAFLKSVRKTAKKPIAVGHSLGADILLNYVRHNGDMLEKLILLDGGYLSQTVDLHVSLGESIANALEFHHNYQFNDWESFLTSEKQSYARWNQNMEAFSGEKMKCDGSKIILRLDTQTLQGLIEVYVQHDGASLLNQVQTDTLLLVSTLPAEVTELRETALSRITNDNVRYNFIPNASHDVYLDQPDIVVNEIVSWLHKTKEEG